VFVSGCLGLDPKTGNFVEGGAEAQTRRALQNLKGIVEASGSQVGKIVKTTVRTVQYTLLIDFASNWFILSARHLKLMIL
jgi:enamine deaminase RidA (YjgF/YER057c/UK114 family)